MGRTALTSARLAALLSGATACILDAQPRPGPAHVDDTQAATALTPTPAPTPAPTTPAAPSAQGSPSTTPGLKVIGRTIALDPNDPAKMRLSWPGVAVGIHFFGSGLAVTMADNNEGQEVVDPPVHNRMDVVVDNVWRAQIALSPTATAYQVATDLPPGEHVIWLRKRTDARYTGRAELLAMDFGSDGTMLPPPPSGKHRLEVIGASIEVGLGDEGVPPCTYSDVTSNQSLAWPQLASMPLDADLTNISAIGMGVLPLGDSGYTARPMPQRYIQADSEDPTSTWDFSRAPADAVVVDLGGNDYMQIAPDDEAGRQRFIAAFGNFVDGIVAKNPKAPVYLMLNPLQHAAKREALGTDLRRVVADAGSRGLGQVRFLELPEYTGTLFGCDGYPEKLLQAAMADAVVARLRSDLGW